jgi:hypothetical protein
MKTLPKLTRCAFSLVLLLAIGCGRGELPRKVIYGAVTCGGQKAVNGSLRFTPIDASSPLPSTSARIVEGHYRVEQWGGVPLGKYRVQVTARGATGRKISDPISGHTVYETIPLSSPLYAGAQSPVIVEVKADGESQINIEIPK